MPRQSSPDGGANGQKYMRPGVALALGGGFARGFAHLGILQVLEQNRIPIAGIAGTSIGSILGAAYASGAPLAKIITVCRNVRFRDFARWRFSRLGLASNQKLADLIRNVIRAQTFEELLIPFVAVATDLSCGEAVVLTHGPLIEALRASCAFPGLFEPVRLGTRCLVDGGLVSPVPAREARALGASCVIGVSLAMHDGCTGDASNVFQVVTRAVSAVQKHASEAWEKQADLVLRPDVQDLAWDDFARAEEAVEAGAAVTLRAMPRILELLSRQARATALDQGRTSGCPLSLAEGLQ